MSEPDQQRTTFAREKARRTIPILLFVLLGLAALYLPLPKRFVAVVPLVIAVVLSVRLLRFLSDRSGREKVWPAVTLIIIGMLLSSLALQGVFYPRVRAFEECLAHAQTAIAAADCEPLRQGIVFGAAAHLP